MSLYESYVGIPLPWLSQMPSHWELLRNKNFLQESKKSVGVDSSDYALLSLTKQGIIPRDVASGKGKFPKDFDTYKIVTSGDLVFCLFDIDETPRTVGLSEHDGMLTGAYTVFKLREINPRFINYYYLALDNVKALRPLYSGLRKTIKTNIFLGTKLTVPPRSEQDQIVRYLDWQVSRTNKLISTLKKQIALLKEQKQVIINEAVTKGLDPSVPMKDSGVEWIGKIPNHWNVVYLFQMATEQFVSNRTVHNQNLLSLSYGKIKNKDINSTDGLLPASFDTYQVIKSGNIILRLTDLQNDHTSLRVGLSTQSGIITSAYTCLLPDVSVLPEYLYLLLHSFDVRKVFYGMGGGVRQSIGYKDMKKLPVLQFSLQEQQKIAAYCLKKQSHIEECIERLEKEISLLGEYRTLLISDVVTGQIDVRDVTVPEFEYVSDETSDTSDDEDIDTEEPEDEEA